MWSAHEEIPIGAIVPTANLWQLSQQWYGPRLSLQWKPRSLDASQELLAAAGLSGPFWSLNNV